jgi:methyl-accepting chemotaxis protein
LGLFQKSRERSKRNNMKSFKWNVVKILFGGGLLPVAGSLIFEALPFHVKRVQIPFHSAIEALGLFAGFSLALLLLLQQKHEKAVPYYRWVSAGLISMGILDGFHASVALGNTFVWLHNLAVLYGGLLFALTWVSGLSKRATRGFILPGMAIGLAIFFGIFSVSSPGLLPKMIEGEDFTRTADAIIRMGGIFFLIATLHFLIRYRANGRSEDNLFAFFSLLNGSAALLFPISHPWYQEWWLWHFIRLAAYLILLIYLFGSLRKTEMELGETKKKLEERLTELSKANQALREMEVAGVVASAANEILAATSQIASGASETAAAVNQAAATLEEVKQTSFLVNQKSKLVTEIALKAEQASVEGKGSVENTIQGINRIREQMESIALNIAKLSERSQAIGEIISTVNDLAEQSNLLSVNAAIEASQAGEYGRGFTVVAQEIKNMAKQSKEATAQVRSLLSDIQRAISQAVMVSEQGSRAVEAGMAQSKQAGEFIQILAGGVEKSAQAATQIEASSRQQVVGTDQLAIAMDHVRKASLQNATAAKQAEVSARNLNTLAQNLKRLIERYKE